MFALCTSAWGRFLASFVYLSHALRLPLVLCGPPMMVRTPSIAGRSLACPLVLTGLCLLECAISALRLRPVYCAPLAIGLTPVYCVPTTLILASIHCILTVLRLIPIHCMLVALELKFFHCAPPALRFNTDLLYLHKIL